MVLGQATFLDNMGVPTGGDANKQTARLLSFNFLPHVRAFPARWIVE